MPRYEYRVIAAPNRGVKAKGITSNEARFAHALEETMNVMAREGWEYQRAETLPSLERNGLASAATAWRNVLVFRRPLSAVVSQPAKPRDILHLKDPVPPAKPLPPTPPQHREFAAPQHPEDDASQSEGAIRMLTDNGVEEVSDVSGMSSSLLQLAAARKHSKSNT